MFCLFILCALLFANVSSIFYPDDQRHQFILNQISTNGKPTMAYYGQFDKCEGYFNRVQMDVIDKKQEWKCNHFWEHGVNVTANGYRSNLRQSLDSLSIQMVKDINGNENYNSKGVVVSGVCRGSILIVQTDLKVSKGKCETGVTELYSKDYSALVAVRGVCETTCYGTVWAHYWPRKQ